MSTKISRNDLLSMEKDDLVNLALKLQATISAIESGSEEICERMKMEFEEQKNQIAMLEEMLYKQMNMTEVYPEPDVEKDDLILLGNGIDTLAD